MTELDDGDERGVPTRHGATASEGTIGGPPVRIGRTAVRSLLWFLGAGLIATAVAAGWPTRVSTDALLTGLMVGGYTAAFFCLVASFRGPSGSTPAVTAGERARERRIRRAHRRDDPTGLTPEEHAAAVRRAPYVAGRSGVALVQAAWLVVGVSGLVLDDAGPGEAWWWSVVLVVPTGLTAVVGVPWIRRTQRFGRRPVLPGTTDVPTAPHAP